MNSAAATNHTYSNMNRRLTLHTIIKLSLIQKLYQFKKTSRKTDTLCQRKTINSKDGKNKKKK